MTFKRKAKLITFPEGHELHGLEIHSRRPTVGAVEAVSGLSETESKVSEQVGALIDTMFAPALITWNYRDELDEPVPATAEGLRQIDIEALLHILNAWVAETVEVGKDLGKESSSGRTFPVQLPAPEAPKLSNALLNLPMHSAPSPSFANSADTH